MHILLLLVLLAYSPIWCVESNGDSTPGAGLPPQAAPPPDAIAGSPAPVNPNSPSPKKPSKQKSPPNQPAEAPAVATAPATPTLTPATPAEPAPAAAPLPNIPATTPSKPIEAPTVTTPPAETPTSVTPVETAPAAIHMPTAMPEKPTVEPAVTPSETIESTAPQPAEASEIDTEEDRDILYDKSERRGNWFERRKIIKMAQQEYEKIREKSSAIQKYEQPLLEKKNSSDIAVTTFFKELGITPASLTEQLNALIELMERERQEEGQLSVEERELLKTLQAHVQEVEGLKAELNHLLDLDKETSQSFTRLLQQTAQALEFEQKAWDNTEKINATLDHLKAQRFLDEIKALSGSLDDTDAYIKQKLSPYMDTTDSTIRGLITSIQQKIESLQSTGITLKKTVEQTVQDAHAQAQKPTEKAVSMGWFASVREIIKNGISRIVQFFSSLW